MNLVMGHVCRVSLHSSTRFCFIADPGWPPGPVPPYEEVESQPNSIRRFPSASEGMIMSESQERYSKRELVETTSPYLIITLMQSIHLTWHPGRIQYSRCQSSITESAPHDTRTSSTSSLQSIRREEGRRARLGDESRDNPASYSLLPEWVTRGRSPEIAEGIAISYCHSSHLPAETARAR